MYRLSNSESDFESVSSPTSPSAPPHVRFRDLVPYHQGERPSACYSGSGRNTGINPSASARQPANQLVGGTGNWRLEVKQNLWIMSKKVVPGIHNEKTYISNSTGGSPPKQPKRGRGRPRKTPEMEEEVVEDIPSDVVKTGYKFLMLTGRERSDFKTFQHRRRNYDTILCLFSCHLVFVIYAMLRNLFREDILQISLAFAVVNSTMLIAHMSHWHGVNVRRWKYYEEFIAFYAISIQALFCITTLAFTSLNTHAKGWETYTNYKHIPLVLYGGLSLSPLLSSILLCTSIEVAICMW